MRCSELGLLRLLRLWESYDAVFGESRRSSLNVKKRRGEGSCTNQSIIAKTSDCLSPGTGLDKVIRKQSCLSFRVRDDSRLVVVHTRDLQKSAELLRQDARRYTFIGRDTALREKFLAINLPSEKLHGVSI